MYVSQIKLNTGECLTVIGSATLLKSTFDQREALAGVDEYEP